LPATFSISSSSTTELPLGRVSLIDERSLAIADVPEPAALPRWDGFVRASRTDPGGERGASNVGSRRSRGLKLRVSALATFFGQNLLPRLMPLHARAQHGQHRGIGNRHGVWRG
jgi:hypothetical protein